MANWNNPTLSTLYTAFLTELKDRDVDLATMFDSGSPSSVPTGAIKWSSANNRWEKWSGSAWAALTTKFLIDVDLLDGQHGGYYTNASNLNVGTLLGARFNDSSHGARAGGSLHPVVTSSVAGFMSAADKNILDAFAPTSGTFTPTVYGSTVAGSFTYSNQSGVYYRIGDLLMINIFITVSSWSAATGLLRVGLGALPAIYATGAKNIAAVSGSNYGFNLTAGHRLGILQFNTTTLNVVSTNDKTFTNFAVANCDSSFQFMLSLMARVA